MCKNLKVNKINVLIFYKLHNIFNQMKDIKKL